MIAVIHVWAEQGANIWWTMADERLEEVRREIRGQIETWVSAAVWQERSEWTWEQMVTGERIEIIGWAEY